MPCVLRSRTGTTHARSVIHATNDYFCRNPEKKPGGAKNKPSILEKNQRNEGSFRRPIPENQSKPPPGEEPNSFSHHARGSALLAA